MLFGNNSASRHGGAIRSEGAIRLGRSILSSHLTSDTMYFTGNKAKRRGGAIFAEFVSVFIGENPSSTSYFLKNSADIGGAIYSYICDVKIQGNSHFFTNFASKEGGAQKEVASIYQSLILLATKLS